MRRGFTLFLTLGLACIEDSNGTGRVFGQFFVPDCTLGEDRPPRVFEFEGMRFDTRRFDDTLEVLVQAHAVDLEETDLFITRIPGLEALRGRSERPLVLPVSLSPEDVNAALSLFTTCPKRPTLHAAAGALILDKFTIARDPEDTGDNEVIDGVLTATVVSAGVDRPVGWFTAEFFFRPESRPPTEPREPF